MDQEQPTNRHRGREALPRPRRRSAWVPRRRWAAPIRPEVGQQQPVDAAALGIGLCADCGRPITAESTRCRLCAPVASAVRSREERRDAMASTGAGIGRPPINVERRASGERADG